MNKNCKLCGGSFDFRKVQISEIFGEMQISFSSNSNNTNLDELFLYCPLCGEKLTKENYSFEEPRLNKNTIISEKIKECARQEDAPIYRGDEEVDYFVRLSEVLEILEEPLS